MVVCRMSSAVQYSGLDTSTGHVYDGFLLFLSGLGPPLFSLGWSLLGLIIQ